MPNHSFPDRSVRTFLAVTALAIAPSATHGAVARRHAHLVKSEPAANDTTAAVTAVRLWFDEKIELPLTRIKVVKASGGIVPLGKPAHTGADEHTPVVSTIPQALAPGTYEVHWSTAGMDGHAARGTIAFVIKSER